MIFERTTIESLYGNFEHQKFAEKHHQLMVEKGFWADDRPGETSLMLIVTELAEAVEAIRATGSKEKDQACVAFASAYLESEISEEEYAYRYKSEVKDSFVCELAGAGLRIIDLLVKKELRLPVALEEIDSFLSHISFDAPERGIKRNDWLCKALLGITEVVCARRVWLAYQLLWGLAYADGWDLGFWMQREYQYNKSRGQKHGKNF